MNFIIYILLFLTIYNPGFRFLNPSLVIFLISFVFIFFNLRLYLSLLKSKRFLYWILFSLLAFFWSFGIDVIFNSIQSVQDLANINVVRKYYWFEILLLFLQTILVFLTIILLLKKKQWDFTSLITALINISILQSVISVLMFFSIPFKEFILSSIIDLNYLFQGENEFYERILYLRINGIGSELTFGFSLFQGLAATLILYKYQEFKSNYIFFIPIIIFSILANARVGLIIPIVFLFFNIKKILKVNAIKLFTLILLVISSLTYLYSNYEAFEILELIVKSGVENGTIIPHQNELFENHLFFPKTFIGLIFGEGLYVFGDNSLNNHSDIGYVNIIYFGGFVFQIILIILYLFFFSKSKNKALNILFYSFIISLFLIQFKGNVFGLNGLTKALMIIFLYKLYFKDNFVNG